MVSDKKILKYNGEYDIRFTNIPRKFRFTDFMTDAFTSLLDSKWRYTILVFILGHLLIWMFYGIAYYLLFDTCKYIKEVESGTNATCTCINNVHSFVTAVLFSVESQHTIGYGYRRVNTECPHVITLVFFQFIMGIAMQCLTVGIVLSKMQRAKSRRETIMFSKHVCIADVDGQQRLMVRIGDSTPTLIIGVKVMGIMTKRSTEDVPVSMKDHQSSYYLETSYIDFKTEGGCAEVMLLWPMVLSHNISKSRNLHSLSKDQFLREYMELIIIVEGLVESSGRRLQARASYNMKDVRFQHRFKDIPLQRRNNSNIADYSDFDTTVPVDYKFVKF